MNHRLSHSQVETFAQCPQIWFLSKVARAPAAPSEHLIFGSAFHETLEADGRAWLERSERLDLETLQAVGAERLKKALQSADPTAEYRERWQGLFSRLSDALAAYHDRVANLINPISVEESFQIALSEQVQFSGKIDAVLDQGGVQTIVDYKTASKPWTDGDQHTKDQASAYLLAKPSAQRVIFIVFSGTQVQWMPTTRDDAAKDRYRHVVLAMAQRIEAARSSGLAEARTSPLCGWCEYLGSCLAGREWLRKKGRVPSVPVVQP